MISDTATEGTENPGPNAGTSNADWPDWKVPGSEILTASSQSIGEQKVFIRLQFNWMPRNI
jgi:hypothetical protein